MIQTTGIRRTRNDNISVACTDCPKCGKETVLARVGSARTGFNSPSQREINCKHCGKAFKVKESELLIRRYPRELIDLQYGIAALPWVE